MFYHVTPKGNLPSILEQGIVPQLGERSLELGEQEKRTYLFPNKQSCIDGLLNWLGDSFEENEELAILEIDPKGLTLEATPSVEYEISTEQRILPNQVLQIFSEEKFQN